MRAPALTFKARRSFRFVGFAGLPVLAVAGIVQVTGVGIDILVLATVALVLFGLERSVGDLLGEWLGPLAAAAIFVVAALALSWYFLADSLGRSHTDSFFIEAERRGYRTAYYETPSSSDADAASPDSSSAALATGGSELPLKATSGRTAAPAAPPDSASEKLASDPESDETKRGVPGQVADRRKESADRRSILSYFRRNDSSRKLIATEIAVTASPRRVAAARRSIITATVRAEDSEVPSGTVEFTVNGLGAGRVQLNVEGEASTTFATHIPGEYEVRARYTGSSDHASSRSAPFTLTVTRQEAPED